MVDTPPPSTARTLFFRVRLRIYRVIAQRLGLTDPQVKRDLGTAASVHSLDPCSFSGEVAWFHAASAGEFESLLPVAAGWLAEIGTHTNRQAVITVFSHSGVQALDRFRRAHPELTAKLLYTGLSPREGEWRRPLASFQPRFFLTVKYETWPDLWAALAELDIPLWILVSRDRRSLRWAAFWVRRVLGAPLPRVTWCAASPGDLHRINGALVPTVPGSQVQVLGDPRWDRVESRRVTGNARVKELVTLVGAAEVNRRFSVVLGNLWLSDLKILQKGLETLQEENALVWIVPHSLEPRQVLGIAGRLRAEGWEVDFTKPSKEGDRRAQGGLSGNGAEFGFGRGQSVTRTVAAPKAIIVNEFGCLAELYGVACGAYVGGGFESGVHSTMEPAIHGLPVSCGLLGIQEFPEVEWLRDEGILDVVTTAEAWAEWVSDVRKSWQSGEHFRNRERIREKIAKDQLGATSRVLSALQDA